MSNQKEKINVAVVGCGMLAQGTHLPNIIRNPSLHLKWCCDIDGEILKKVKDEFPPDKIASNPEIVAQDSDCSVVILCTHHEVRKDLIKLFAEAGKHIYAEKPLVNTFEEIKEIYEIVKGNNVGFCLGHNRRCAPAIKEAKRIYLKHKANPVNPAWRYDREGLRGPDNDWSDRTLVLMRVNDDALSWKKWAFEEGTLYVEMTHFVDIACYLTDLKPVAVTVIGDAATNYSVSSINIEFEDNSLAVIASTANGTFGYPKELFEVYYGGAAIVVDHCVELRVAGVVDEPFWRTFPLDGDPYPHIYANGGIDDFHRKTLALHQDVLSGKKDSCPPPFPNKGHYEMLDDFIKAAVAGLPGPSDITASAISSLLILKAAESAKSGGKREEIDISGFVPK